MPHKKRGRATRISQMIFLPFQLLTYHKSMSLRKGMEENEGNETDGNIHSTINESRMKSLLAIELNTSHREIVLNNGRRQIDV
jgi:hypothetical protein